MYSPGDVCIENINEQSLKLNEMHFFGILMLIEKYHIEGLKYTKKMWPKKLSPPDGIKI